MATRSKFRHEDVATVPRGHRVRTVTTPTGHKVRIAFPPGPRRAGAGKLISILHPQTEANPCPKNPLQELVKDSKGKQWWVNILGGEGRGFTGQLIEECLQVHATKIPQSREKAAVPGTPQV